MKVSLFLITFLAPHRVKASATPDQHFDPRHPRLRSDDRRHGYLFGGSLRARGSSRQKSPSSPASRSDLRARGKPGRGGASSLLAYEPVRACRDRVRLGRCRSILRLASGVDRRVRAARPCCERGPDVYGKSSLAQTSVSASAAP